MPVESSVKFILVFVCVSIIVNFHSGKDPKCPWDLYFGRACCNSQYVHYLLGRQPVRWGAFCLIWAIGVSELIPWSRILDMVIFKYRQ